MSDRPQPPGSPPSYSRRPLLWAGLSLALGLGVARVQAGAPKTAQRQVVVALADEISLPPAEAVAETGGDPEPSTPTQDRPAQDRPQTAEPPPAERPKPMKTPPWTLAGIPGTGVEIWRVDLAHQAIHWVPGQAEPATVEGPSPSGLSLSSAPTGWLVLGRAPAVRGLIVGGEAWSPMQPEGWTLTVGANGQPHLAQWSEDAGEVEAAVQGPLLMEAGQRAELSFDGGQVVAAGLDQARRLIICRAPSLDAAVAGLGRAEVERAILVGLGRGAEDPPEARRFQMTEAGLEVIGAPGQPVKLAPGPGTGLVLTRR